MRIQTGLTLDDILDSISKDTLKISTDKEKFMKLLKSARIGCFMSCNREDLGTKNKEYASKYMRSPIKKEDCKTLFANYTFSNRDVLENKKDEKNFVFSQFIQLIYSEEQTDSRENIEDKKTLLEDIAVANIMLSRVILNQDGFMDCNFYLDTPILRIA